MAKKMMQFPLKKDKYGQITILFHKNLYRLSIIRSIVKDIEGVDLDSNFKNYIRLKLKTNDSKKVLEFCNYLLSKHN